MSAVFFHPCGSRRKIIKGIPLIICFTNMSAKAFGISYNVLIMHIMNALQELAIDTLCSFDSYPNEDEKFIIAYVKTVISCS
jgi:hypothetical protein